VTILSASEFLRLRSSDVPAEYHRAAHDDAAIDVWRDVIEQYPDMRFWVAQNKTVPVDGLRLLATDQDWKVRSMVAMKRKLPDDLCTLLALDSNDAVRQSIARHRNTPDGVLSVLAADSWPPVAEAAAREVQRRSSLG